MFDVTDLQVPIIAAPMAGGPTTPDLVIAAARAGGLGFLAAGYASPEATLVGINTVAGSGLAFGVNIFAPGRPLRDHTAVQSYRDALAPLGQRYGVAVPEPKTYDDDHFAAKLDLVIQRHVPVVSFTFGLPSAAEVDRLHRADIAVIASIADAHDAPAALDVGVDALCVQGMEAGGHRATLDVDATPNTTPTIELLGQVGELTKVPLIAAGGIGDGTRIDACLSAGASAVQIGTALLDSVEAGTNSVHRAALRDTRFADTIVTRAFSGRPARALRNTFVDVYDPIAPAEYPAIHHLTSPLRKAAVAAGDCDNVNLWAGTAHHNLPRGSAAGIIAELWSASTTGPRPSRRQM